MELTAMVDAYRTVTDEVFATIDTVLDGLDDDTVNAVPEVPGANSVFVLVTHLRGVVADWGAGRIGGAAISRDRDAEFEAAGTVDQARADLEWMRRRLTGYVRLGLTLGVHHEVPVASDRDDADTASAELTVLHLLRELAQHTGQMQITADLVRAAGR